MARFDRFMRLTTLCMLSSCALATETDETIKIPPQETNTSTPAGYSNSKDVPYTAPCHTVANFVTPTGLVVTVYLDCYAEKPRGPVSDEPEGKNSGITTIIPGWTRPQPPGDPKPQLSP